MKTQCFSYACAYDGRSEKALLKVYSYQSLSFLSSLYLFIYLLVLPVSCYQPISLHPRAHTISHVIPWTSAHQTPLSMDFSRQDHWSGLPFPSPCIESFKVPSLRCGFDTCTRLSSNMPFLPKCSRSHPHFPTCLSSELWSMYCLSSPERQDILETLLTAVSSGGCKCFTPQDFTKHFLQPQLEEKSTLVTVTGFHGLDLIMGCAFIIIVFPIPTKMSLRTFFSIIIVSWMFI